MPQQPNKIEFDQEKVNKYLADIKSSVERLEKFKGMSLKEFKEDQENIDLATYRLRRAIEGVLALGTHILARVSGSRRQKDYSEVLLSLGRLEVLPMDFAEKIYEMAGFRNALVHDYLEVDAERVYENIQNSLEDFEKFNQHVADFVKQHSQEE